MHLRGSEFRLLNNSYANVAQGVSAQACSTQRIKFYRGCRCHWKRICPHAIVRLIIFNVACTDLTNIVECQSHQTVPPNGWITLQCYDVPRVSLLSPLVPLGNCVADLV